ncbi:MAG: hypothetical protein C4536_08300 [Actinobacteria bacterium]|jgi:hypothetical protein|nr:MAG: hypothetical protein C4536_08300 [Actinomycetota bacterium]
MDEALTGDTGEEIAPAAQAGKLLCVSETIFPHGSRHSMNLVYHGIGTGGAARHLSDVRMAGKEFVDLRELDPASPMTPGEPATRSCRRGFAGGGAFPG